MRQETTTRQSQARTATQPASIKPHPDALQFFTLLYSRMAGWCELSIIMGDPSTRVKGKKKKKRPAFTLAELERMSAETQHALIKEWGYVFGREWHYVAGDYTALGERCAFLGAQFGNVYTSRTLYTDKRRSLDCAVPSRVVFVDDIPATPALMPSMLVETSAENYHGYYVTAEPLSSTTNNALARRAAAALGADRSGADTVQIVRVPGTFNTKHGGSVPVQLITTSGPRYTSDELNAAWPELDTVGAMAMHLDDSRVAWWLGNLELLLDYERLPRRVRNPQARARFAQHSTWRDSSAYRYTIARSLVMHGYPDEEAAALLIYFCDAGAERKGGDWLNQDIARCLQKVRSEIAPYQGIQPTSLTAKYQAKLPQPLPAHAPRRKGRPTSVTADALLAFYHERADTPTHCLLSRADVCAALGISNTTLTRLEKALTQQGAIYRQTADNRRRSWVVFGGKPADLGITKNTQISTETRALSPIFGYTHTAVESPKTDAADMLKEHTPLIAPASPPVPRPQAQPSGAVCSFPSAPDPWAVADAVQQSILHAPQLAATLPPPAATQPEPAQPTLSLTGAVQQVLESSPMRVNETTGEIMAKVWTVQRVITAIEAQYGSRWDSTSIAYTYRRERKRKNTAAFVEYKKVVQAMPTADLAQEAAKKQKIATKSAGKPRESYHRAMSAIAHEELTRRRDKPAPAPAPAPTPTMPTAQPERLTDVPAALLNHASALITALDYVGYESLKAAHPAYDWSDCTDLRPSYQQWKQSEARSWIS